jgi:septal ring factor EnvC (AmiA/AmiB activator)
LKPRSPAIRADRAALNKALLERPASEPRPREPHRRDRDRLALLQSSESAIRRSLEGRRHLIAEVLAALQRIGRRPPPAVLVRPEDILEAVRASMLLGAVVPDLRQEIEILGTDLANWCACATASPTSARRSRPRWSTSLLSASAWPR